METIGYKIEGLKRNSGIRNEEYYSTILFAINRKDFYHLIAKRGDKLITSLVKMYEMKLRNNMIPDIKKFLEKINK